MRPLTRLAIVVVLLLLSLQACAPAVPTAPAKQPAASTSAAPVPTTATLVSGASPAATKPAAAPTATPAAKIKRGGILTYARERAIVGFDPIMNRASYDASYMTYEHFFDAILTDREKGIHELRPQLAESWEYTNPTTLIVKLKKGIKFSDGSELNAEVAKWNLDRVRTHPKSEGKDFVDAHQSVDIVDPYTIRINLSRPSASALIKLSSRSDAATTMISKAAFDKGGDDYLYNNPIGTGPMMLQEWIRGDRVILKKRADYWQMGDDGQPLPYLDGFVERYIPDFSVTFIEMRAGNVNLTNQIRLVDVAAAKANPELTFDERAYTSQLRFVYGFSQKRGPFKDNLKLRQAAHYAIDRESMVKTMGFGIAKPAYYMHWIPGMPGYDDSITKYTYDLNKGKQLLAEAGYPNGLDVTLTTIARDPDRQIAEIAKFMWDAVGIRTKIDSMERAAALQVWKGGDYDLGFAGAGGTEDPDVVTRDLVCNGSNNLVLTCNPQFDACMAEGGAVINDDKKRDEVYKRCLKIFQEDAIKQAGYLESRFFIYSKFVKGFTSHWTYGDSRRVWLDK